MFLFACSNKSFFVDRTGFKGFYICLLDKYTNLYEDTVDRIKCFCDIGGKKALTYLIVTLQNLNHINGLVVNEYDINFGVILSDRLVYMYNCSRSGLVRCMNCEK